MDDFLGRLRFRREHRWAPGRMSAFLDGELSAKPRGRMEHHLAQCRECRRLLAGLTLVVDALHRMSPPEAVRGPETLARSVITVIRTPPA